MPPAVMSKLKRIQVRARKLANPGKFYGWSPIAFALRFEDGFEEAREWLYTTTTIDLLNRIHPRLLRKRDELHDETIPGAGPLKDSRWLQGLSNRPTTNLNDITYACSKAHQISAEPSPLTRRSSAFKQSCVGSLAVKTLLSSLALALALGFAMPAFAGDVTTAKNAADCEKAGGVWDAAKNAYYEKKM